MIDVVELDGTTGEVTQRDFTPEETAQREADRLAAEQAAVEAAARAQQVAEARDAAITHAKSLGFTDEMIAVMYPGLT